MGFETAHVQKNLEGSNAFYGGFFDKSERATNVPHARTALYARNWSEITQTFGLMSTQFLGVIAKTIAHEEVSDEKRWALETFLQNSAMIVSDDLGLFRGNDGKSKTGKIHYKLFDDMCAPLHISQYPLVPETEALSEAIQSAFQSIGGGMACFIVIEGIAYNIVKAQLPLFLATKKDGKRMFKKKDLDYINLHLKIEKEHSKESLETLKLCSSLEIEGEFITQTEKLLVAFEKFWARMETEVFA